MHAIAARDADVEDTHRVSYRFRVTNPSERYTVEQRAYYHARDGRLSYLRVLCSGYRTVGGAAS